MAEEKVEVKDINFRQVLPWTELFRGFQVALDPKKLLLAAAGIVVMAFGWWLLSVVFYTEKPKWPGEYKSAAPKDLQGTAEEVSRKTDELAWKAFKDDRHKWEVIHGAAGSAHDYTDAGYLASSPQEWEEINNEVNKAIDAMSKTDEIKRTVVIAGRPYEIVRRSYGALRTLPWNQDRGPNPYLLVTGQAGIPWEGGRFGDWLLTKQAPVLVEPLVKFLYPVVYLLSPRTGGLNRFYFLLVTLWTLATWALFGGAITRMASVQIARNDKIGMTEAIKFVTSRYLSFLSAPIFPLLFVGAMVVGLSIYGLLFMIPVVGDILVAGVFWPLVFLAGLMMAVVLIGLVGWPMMYATIRAEGSDSFDAISRSYSYVYQSPWSYAWYSLVALGYGAIVVFFIGFMGSMVVYLGKWGVSYAPFIETADREPSFLFVYAPTSFGWRTLLLQGTMVDGQPLVEDGRIQERPFAKLTGQDEKYKGPDRMTWYNQAGAVMVAGWLYLFFLLILGFGYSYFWSASTIIYLLMRRKVDDTDIDEVYLEEDDGEDSYTTSTSMPAPASASPASSAPSGGGSSLQMVESPTLRAAPPPAKPEPTPEPVHSEATAKAPAGDGDGKPSDGHDSSHDSAHEEPR